MSMYITDAGQALETNAKLYNKAVVLTHFVVGDGVLPTNNADLLAMTELVNQVDDVSINRLAADETNANWLIIEGIIPPDAGPYEVAEVGILAEDGTLYAVGEYPRSVKPKATSGTWGKELYIKATLATSNADIVQIKVDNTLVAATRAFVIDRVEEHAQSRNHPDATTTAKGFMQFGTSEQTREGTRTDRAAHLAGVKAAIDSRAASQSEMAAGESETQFIAVKRLIEQLATGEEAQALSSLTKILTPGTLDEAFRGDNQGNEYQVLPGGKIIQCGNVQAANGDQVSFPVEFPTSARSIAISDLTGTSGEINNQAAASLNRSGFEFRTSSGNAESFSYIVFGD